MEIQNTYKLIIIGIIFLTFLLQLPNHTYLQRLSSSQIRDLKWNDINFIHTTDTHGWYSGHLNQKQYNGDWGDFISFTTHMREIASSKGQDLLIIDTGDKHDGNGLSDVTVPNGSKALPIFLKQDYDLLTIGNHELYLWENSKQEFEVIVKHFGSNYISSNVEYRLDNGTFVPFGERYKYLISPNKKLRILAFGFLFDFNRNNEFTRIKSIRQVTDEETWFREILQIYPFDKVDLIVIIGHIPVSHEWPELYYLHSYLRKTYPATKIQYFGGHSHIRDFTLFDENSTGLQSGRFCETIGWTSINLDESITDVEEKYSRAYIDFNTNSFLHHTNFADLSNFTTEKGSEVSKLINETRQELNLNKVIGHINENYYVDYVPITHSKNIFQFLTNRILPTLPPSNSNLTLSNETIIIINTGSIRYDLYKGPYTLDTQYIVSPFENDWVKVTLPKNIAVQIAPKLNEDTYISSQAANDTTIDNRRLLPEHQYAKLMKSERSKKRQERFRYPLFQFDEPDKLNMQITKKQKTSKGYITYDDFGNNGDDTPHKPVINYPLPNVVESKQLNGLTSDEALVDVVFYSFISPNILWALNELNYNLTQKIEFYSDKYLGLMINEYVQSYDI